MRAQGKDPAGPVVREWVVALRPDGVVDAVDGGAPVTWLGHFLSEARNAPDVIRNAAWALMHDAASTEYLRRKKVRLYEDGNCIEVELLLVEGLPLRRAHTRIDKLLMRTLDVFVSQAQSCDVDLTVEQASNVPAALVIDSEKIAWAIATLVGNALRFASQRESRKDGGHVHVHVDWDESRDDVVLCVKDNGPGMSERRARWLFDRDPTSGKPSGLALLMVRDVMVAHRGSVSVESTVGHGTTFTLRIPKAR